MEIISILVLCVAVYLPTIFFHAIVDDIRWLDGIMKGKLGGRRKLLTKFVLRLYGAGTFARMQTCSRCHGERNVPSTDEKRKTLPCPTCQATGRAWHVDLRIEHAFTMALHTLACVLIYLALGRNQVSFLAALLYAVNPTNLQTSVWLNGRRYLVNVIIVLLMILGGPWALPLYLITPLMQVNAIFAPTVYGWWGLALSLVGIAVSWRMIIKRRVDRRMESIVNDDMKTFSVGRIVISIRTFGFYVLQMILPLRTMMVYSFLSTWGLTKEGNHAARRIDGYFVVGCLSLIASAIGFSQLAGPERWWLAFGTIALIQQCNIIPATQTIADRYCSVANVFVMYFLAKLLGPVGAIPLVVAYIVLLPEAMKLYRDINSYYDYHLYHDPAGTIVRKFKINWLLRTDDVMGAWELVKAGLIRNPTEFALLYQAAVVMAKMGDLKMMAHYLDKAEQNHYLNQEPLWRDHIKELRAQAEVKKQESKKPRIHPMDFARGKR